MGNSLDYNKIKREFEESLKNRGNDVSHRSEFFKYRLKLIGAECRKNRIEEKITQSEIARSIACSPQLISLFEQGKTDSAVILCEYINRGLF